MSSPSQSHTLRSFDDALKETRSNILTMASLARQNLDSAVKGLLERNRELCSEVIDEDEEVNQLERVVDRESFSILMRYTPVASDLRVVLAGMKVANNLEKISDHAESIAKRSRKVLKGSEVSEIQLVRPIHEIASGMLGDAIRAYADGDVKLALAIAERDKELDRLHRQAVKSLAASIEGDTANLKTYLHLVFIVGCLERIGDHATNISEETVFAEKSADIRHMGIEEAAKEAGVTRGEV